MRRREALAVAIKAVHADAKARYGSPRIHAELVARGKSCCVNTAARLTPGRGVAAKTKRKFRCATDSNHGRPVAENLVDRQFEPGAADEVWTADITDIPTREGWLYLAAVEGLHPRRIVGWSMSDRIDSRPVVGAPDMAVARRLPGDGPVAHSDRGSRYASEHYQRLLAGHGIACSMSRRGDCRDDAPWVVLHEPEKGDGPPGVRHEGGGEGQPVRVHRGVPRPGPASLVAGLSVSRRVRASRITVNSAPAIRGEVQISVSSIDRVGILEWPKV